MEVIALRSLTIDGTTYQAGDAVKGLSPEKAGQLIEQRWLRQKTVRGMEYVVIRALTIKGKTYTRGQRVKVTTLPSAKLAQFLEQRILEPAPA